MTEPTLPTGDDDLLSAVLDGEATDAEVARVAADPALQARLDRMAAISDGVGLAPPPPAGLVDQAIGSALDHLAPARPAAVAAPVDELSARRAAPRRRFGPLLAAAAVVVLVALGAVAVTSRDDAERTDTAAAELDATGDADADPAGAEEFAEADADGGTADDGAAAPTEALAEADAGAGSRAGEVIEAADTDEFARQVELELEGTPEASVPTTAAEPVDDPAAADEVDCPGAGDLTGRSGATIRSGSGLLSGVPVSYSVVDAPEGLLLVIVDAECGVIAEIDLRGG